MFDTRLIFLTIDNERKLQIEHEKQIASRGGPRADFSDQNHSGIKSIYSVLGRMFKSNQGREISSRAAEPAALIRSTELKAHS
jgi:hypothetical protein